MRRSRSKSSETKNAGNGVPFYPAAQTVFPAKPGKRNGPYWFVSRIDPRCWPIGRERRKMLTGDGMATTFRPDLSGKGHKYAGESLSLVRSRKGGTPSPYRRAERAELWENEMKVLVCGGRDYRDVDNVIAILDGVHARNTIEAVINGGCGGADEISTDWAIQNEITCIIEPARWTKEGKAAGPKRNARMIDKWKPDGVVAFPGGRGTANMVSLARAAGIKVFEVA